MQNQQQQADRSTRQSLQNKRCSSIGVDHYLGDSLNITGDEQEVLDCFAVSLSTCGPAILEIIGESTSTMQGLYQVQKGENNYCIMSKSSRSAKTCKISMEYINGPDVVVKDNNKARVFLTIGSFEAGQAFGSVRDGIYKAPVKFDCQQI